VSDSTANRRTDPLDLLGTYCREFRLSSIPDDTVSLRGFGKLDDLPVALVMQSSQIHISSKFGEEVR
jgi:hypothetical protein